MLRILLLVAVLFAPSWPLQCAEPELEEANPFPDVEARIDQRSIRLMGDAQRLVRSAYFEMLKENAGALGKLRMALEKDPKCFAAAVGIAVAVGLALPARLPGAAEFTGTGWAAVPLAPE